MIPLVPILSKIPEKIQSFRPATNDGGLHRRKIFSTFFDFARSLPKFRGGWVIH